MKRTDKIFRRQIKLGERELVYTLRVSSQTRYLRLAVRSDGSLTVTQPRLVTLRVVENYLREKAGWIISKIDYFKRLNSDIKPVSRRQYLADAVRARKFVQDRISCLNQFYNFSIKRISIRNQKTRWGSCSKKGNLNFNYKIIFLPQNLADLIIVHELCHLQEFNHSPKFWQLVFKVLPNYKNLKMQLRKINILAMA